MREHLGFVSPLLKASPQVPAAPCVCFVSFQPPVSMGMYRSSYKRDYRWGEDYKPPSKEDMKVPGLFLAWPFSPRCQVPYRGYRTTGDQAGAKVAAGMGALCTARDRDTGPRCCDPPTGHITPKCPWLVPPSLLREIPLAPSSKAVWGRRC